MISSLAWMPRGKARAVPNKYEPTDEEMEQMRKEARLLGGALPPGLKDADDDEWEDMSDEDEEEDAAEAKAKAIRKASKAAKVAQNMGDDDLAEYNLDDYDDEQGGVIGVLGPAGLSVFASNDEDPYVTLPDEEDDSDLDEDNMIRPSDAIILACHTEEDAHTLDVYVYDDSEGTLFVHHDLMLNAFPLCVTWMDTATKDGAVGNFAALGTMDTEIEVWDLDCIDRMTPAAVLGGIDKSGGSGGAGGSQGKKKKKKNKDKPNLKADSHRDAVLGMSWHPLQRHVLASASADKTVKIWDVPQEKCLHTLTHHTDKVQSLQWHPTQAAVLLTGGFDRNASVCDVRATAADWKTAAKWAVSSDVECVAWDPQSEHQFLVSTDSGNVTCHDARYAGKDPIFTIGAHTDACTGLAVNPLVPGLLATASLDKSVKLWDIRGGKVEYLGTRTLDFGQVFCCGFCNDPATPYILALGGKDGKVLVCDTVANPSVRQRFPTGKKDSDYAGVDEAMEKMALDGQDSSDYSDEEEEDAIQKAKGEAKEHKKKNKKKGKDKPKK
jgi:periodic tryptophan protein 1